MKEKHALTIHNQPVTNNVSHTNTMKVAPIIKTWNRLMVLQSCNALKNVRKAKAVLELNTSLTMALSMVSNRVTARLKSDPTLMDVM